MMNNEILLADIDEVMECVKAELDKNNKTYQRMIVDLFEVYNRKNDLNNTRQLKDIISEDLYRREMTNKTIKLNSIINLFNRYTYSSSMVDIAKKVMNEYQNMVFIHNDTIQIKKEEEEV